MINIKDLQIGDWVRTTYCPYQVDAIYNNGRVSAGLVEFDSSELNGIPIIVEILEKNGFVLSKKSSRKPYQLRDNSIYVSIIKGRLNARYYERFGKPINAMQIDCNYVHELQRALRMCKIDKIIEL